MDTLNYKMGWLVVMFDLPTLTPVERRNAALFRKRLLEDGYLMIQYSVYARLRDTRPRAHAHAPSQELSAAQGARALPVRHEHPVAEDFSVLWR